MKTALILLCLASPLVAKDPPKSLVWKHHVVWCPADSTTYERSAYLERASCNHLIALPYEKVYDLRSTKKDQP